MEFVAHDEALALLREQGIREVGEGTDRVSLEFDDSGEVVHLHLSCPDSTCAPHSGANTVTMAKDRLPGAVEHILHKLHLSQILLIPVGKWRKVFDAVAFSLADNEDWQAVDTAATVELNSRDPLLCEPADFHTVSALVRALLDDADRPEQGLMLASTVAPVLVELIPDGAARMSFGNRVLADEVAEAWNVGSA